MAGHRSFKARKKFLDALEKGYSFSRAAREAGETTSFFRSWIRDDPDFSKDHDEAYEAGTDCLEDRARDRAMRDSDSLMKTLLQARRPDKYRVNTSVEHSGGIDLTGARERLAAKFAAMDAESEGEEDPS